MTKVCKLSTDGFIRRTCDVVHGLPEPSFETCINDGKLIWDLPGKEVDSYKQIKFHIPKINS